MQKIIRWLLGGLIERAVAARLPGCLAQVDPSKYYILVLPEDLKAEDVQQALKPLRFANLMVIQANNVRLMEFD